MITFYWLNLISQPIAAPAITNQAELTLGNLSRTARLAIATMIVQKSIKVPRPNSHATAAINPIEAAFTPSRKPAVQGDLRNFATNGLINGTRINAGKNIPIVPAIAPIFPATR